MVSLHTANGEYVADVVTEEDMTQATTRDSLIASEGVLYAWNQRNAQWREVAGVIEPTSRTEPEAAPVAEEPAAVEESVPEPQAEAAPESTDG